MQVGFRTPVIPMPKPRFGQYQDSKNISGVVQGKTLPPTPIRIENGKLDVILKETSTANLKRDVWMVEDTDTQQKYSLMVDGGEKRLELFYDAMSNWGKGTPIEVEGTAMKPVPQQRYPFLMVDSIRKK